LSSVSEAPWDWAASILLRAEAQHRQHFVQSPSDRDENPFIVGDRWTAPSLRTLRALLDHAAQANDERLRAYCRQWQIIALNVNGGQYLSESLDLFPRDATVWLARGRHYEFAMGPETEGPIGFFWFTPGASSVTADGMLLRDELTVRTAHGLFGTDTSKKAVDAYQDALALDPELTEARLRLGRVLYLLDRNPDALRELERAFDDARRRGEVGTAYLAALFAGQIHEFDGRPEQAVASYRKALAMCPRCPAAPSAVLILQLTSGRSAEGWQVMDDLFHQADDSGAVATDPWVTYTIPPWSFMLVQRYAALRAWIRLE
jgi:tetratricopeptide (TPR) repeat protein